MRRATYRQQYHSLHAALLLLFLFLLLPLHVLLVAEVTASTTPMNHATTTSSSCWLLAPLLEVVERQASGRNQTAGTLCSSQWSGQTIENNTQGFRGGVLQVHPNCTVNVNHVADEAGLSTAAQNALVALRASYPAVQHVAVVVLDNLTVSNAASFHIDVWWLQQTVVLVDGAWVMADAVLLMSRNVTLRAGSRLWIHATLPSVVRNPLCVDLVSMTSSQSSVVIQGTLPPLSGVRVRESTMEYDFSAVRENPGATVQWSSVDVELGVVGPDATLFSRFPGSAITTWVVAPVVLQDVGLRGGGSIVFSGCRIRGVKMRPFATVADSGSVMRIVDANSRFIGVPALIAVTGNTFTLDSGSVALFTGLELEVQTTSYPDDNIFNASAVDPNVAARWVNASVAGAVVFTSGLSPLRLTNGSWFGMSNVTVRVNGTVAVPCVFHHPPSIVVVPVVDNASCGDTTAYSSFVQLVRPLLSPPLMVSANSTFSFVNCTFHSRSVASSDRASDGGGSAMVYGGAVVLRVQLASSGSCVIHGCDVAFVAPISTAIASFRAAAALYAGASSPSVFLRTAPFGSTIASGTALLSVLQQQLGGTSAASVVNMAVVAQSSAPPPGALVIDGLSAVGASEFVVTNTTLLLQFPRDESSFPTEGSLSAAISSTVKFVLPETWSAALMLSSGVSVQSASAVRVDGCLVEAADSAPIPSVADLWMSGVTAAVSLQSAASLVQLQLTEGSAFTMSGLQTTGNVWIEVPVVLGGGSNFTIADVASWVCSVPNTGSTVMQWIAGVGISQSVMVTSGSHVVLSDVSVTMERYEGGTTGSSIASAVFLAGSVFVEQQGSTVVERVTMTTAVPLVPDAAMLSQVVAVLFGGSFVYVSSGGALRVSNVTASGGGVSGGLVACPLALFRASLTQPASADGGVSASWTVSGVGSAVIVEGIIVSMATEVTTNASRYVGGVAIQGSVSVEGGGQWVLRAVSIVTAFSASGGVLLRGPAACQLFTGASSRVSVSSASYLGVHGIVVSSPESSSVRPDPSTMSEVSFGVGIWLGLASWVVSNGSVVEMDAWRVSGPFSEGVHVGGDWAAASAILIDSPSHNSSIAFTGGGQSSVMWHDWVVDLLRLTYAVVSYVPGRSMSLVVVGIRWPDTMSIESKASSGGSRFSATNFTVETKLFISEPKATSRIALYSAGWWLPSNLLIRGDFLSVGIVNATVFCRITLYNINGNAPFRCVGPFSTAGDDTNNQTLWNVSGIQTRLSVGNVSVETASSGTLVQPVHFPAVAVAGVGSAVVISGITVRCPVSTTVCLQVDAAPLSSSLVLTSSVVVRDGGSVVMAGLRVSMSTSNGTGIGFLGGFDVQDSGTLNMTDVTVSMSNDAISMVSTDTTAASAVDLGSGNDHITANNSSVTIDTVRVTIRNSPYIASGLSMGGSLRVTGRSCLSLSHVDVNVSSPSSSSYLHAIQSVSIGSTTMLLQSRFGNYSLTVTDHSTIAIREITSWDTSDIVVGDRIVADGGSRVLIGNVSAVRNSMMYVGGGYNSYFQEENRVTSGSTVELRNVSLSSSSVRVTNSWHVDGIGSVLSVVDVRYRSEVGVLDASYVLVAAMAARSGLSLTTTCRLVASNGGLISIVGVTMQSVVPAMTPALIVSGTVTAQDGGSVVVSGLNLAAAVAVRLLGALTVSNGSSFTLRESVLRSVEGPSGAFGGAQVTGAGSSLVIKDIEFEIYGWALYMSAWTDSNPSVMIRGGAQVSFSNVSLSTDTNAPQRLLLFCGGGCLNGFSGFTPFLVASDAGSRLTIDNVRCNSLKASSVVIGGTFLYDGAEVVISRSVFGQSMCFGAGVNTSWLSDKGALMWESVSASGGSRVRIENTLLTFCLVANSNGCLAVASELQLSGNSSFEVSGCTFYGYNSAVNFPSVAVSDRSTLRIDGSTSYAALGLLSAGPSALTFDGFSSLVITSTSSYEALVTLNATPMAITDHSTLNITGVAITTTGGARWEVARIVAAVSIRGSSSMTVRSVTFAGASSWYNMYASPSLLVVTNSVRIDDASFVAVSAVSVTIAGNIPASLVDLSGAVLVTGGSSFVIEDLTVAQCNADGLPAWPNAGGATSTAVLRLSNATLQTGGSLSFRRVSMVTAAAVVLPNAIRLNGNVTLDGNATFAIEDVVFLSLGTAFLSTASTATWVVSNRSRLSARNVRLSNSGPNGAQDAALVNRACGTTSFPDSIVPGRAAEAVLNAAPYLLSVISGGLLQLSNVTVLSTSIAAIAFGMWALSGGSAALDALQCSGRNATKSVDWAGPVALSENSTVRLTSSTIRLDTTFVAVSTNAAVSFSAILMISDTASLLVSNVLVQHTHALRPPTATSTCLVDNASAVLFSDVMIVTEGRAGESLVIDNTTLLLSVTSLSTAPAVVLAPLRFNRVTTDRVSSVNGSGSSSLPAVRISRSLLHVTHQRDEVSNDATPDTLSGVLFAALNQLSPTATVRLLANDVVVEGGGTAAVGGGTMSSCMAHRWASAAVGEAVLNRCRITVANTTTNSVIGNATVSTQPAVVLWRHVELPSCFPSSPEIATGSVVAVCNTVNQRVLGRHGEQAQGGVAVGPADSTALLASVVQQSPGMNLLPLMGQLCPNSTHSASASTAVSRTATWSASGTPSSSPPESSSSSSRSFSSSRSASMSLSMSLSCNSAPRVRVVFPATMLNVRNATAPIGIVFAPLIGASCAVASAERSVSIRSNADPAVAVSNVTLLLGAGSVASNNNTFNAGDVVCGVGGVNVTIVLLEARAGLRGDDSLPFNVTLQLHPSLFACQPALPVNVTVPVLLVFSPRSGSSDTTAVPSTVATVAAVPLALVGAGGTAAGMQRALLQFQLAACDYSLDDELDVASNPTRLGFGPSAGRFVRGSVVGNLLLLVGLTALCGSAAWARAALVRWRSGREMSVWRGAASLALPGALVSPYLFVVQPLVSSCVTLLAHSDELEGAADTMLAVAGLVVALVPGCLLTWLVTLRLPRCAVAVRLSRWAIQQRLASHQRRGRWVEAVGRLLLPAFEWEDTSVEPGFVKRYGRVFEAYVEGRGWYGSVELWVSVVCGALGGVQPTGGGSCAWLLGAICAVNCAVLLAVVLLRPFNSWLELAVALLTSLAGVLWGGSVLGNVQGVANTVAAVQVYLGALSTVTLALSLIASRRFRRMVERWSGFVRRTLRHRRQGEPLMSAETSFVFPGSIVAAEKGGSHRDVDVWRNSRPSPRVRPPRSAVLTIPMPSADVFCKRSADNSSRVPSIGLKSSRLTFLVKSICASRSLQADDASIQTW